MENAHTDLKVNTRKFLLVLFEFWIYIPVLVLDHSDIVLQDLRCSFKLLTLQVNVPLNEIEFLNLDDVDSKQERAFLLGCVQSKEGEVSF